MDVRHRKLKESQLMSVMKASEIAHVEDLRVHEREFMGFPPGHPARKIAEKDKQESDMAVKNHDEHPGAPTNQQEIKKAKKILKSSDKPSGGDDEQARRELSDRAIRLRMDSAQRLNSHVKKTAKSVIDLINISSLGTSELREVPMFRIKLDRMVKMCESFIQGLENLRIRDSVVENTAEFTNMDVGEDSNG